MRNLNHSKNRFCLQQQFQWSFLIILCFCINFFYLLFLYSYQEGPLPGDKWLLLLLLLLLLNQWLRRRRRRQQDKSKQISRQLAGMKQEREKERNEEEKIQWVKVNKRKDCTALTLKHCCSLISDATFMTFFIWAVFYHFRLGKAHLLLLID